jgi:hypothetical protein
MTRAKPTISALLIGGELQRAAILLRMNFISGNARPRPRTDRASIYECRSGCGKINRCQDAGAAELRHMIDCSRPYAAG